MKITPPKLKPKSKSIIPKRFRTKGWSILGTIILILLVIFIVLRIQDNQRKSDAKKRVESVLHTLEESGVESYSNLRDAGCSTSQVGLLGSNTVCEYVGDIIFEGKGDLRADLSRLDKLLQNSNWQYSLYSAKNAVEQLQGNEESDSIIYTPMGIDRSGAKLYFSKSNEKFASEQIKGYEIPQSVSIGRGEYIYGVHLYSMYRESMAPFGWFGK